MCGNPPEELKKDFDFKTRNIVRDGIAGRHIGEWDCIISEIEKCGFKLLYHEVEKAKNDEDNDTLIYVFKG